MMLIAALIFAAVLLMTLAAIRFRSPPGDDGPDQAPTRPQRPSFLERWEEMARQAGLPWTRTTYAGFVLGAIALGLLLTMGGFTILAVLAVLGGLAGPSWYVQRRWGARSEQMLQQLPQALFLATSVLRSGGTFIQAVGAVATELPAPLGAEFKLVQQEMLLGMPAYEAMGRAQERIGLREFAAVVVAVRIGMELGGDLAHLFDQIARFTVDQQNAQRTLKAFTTEGRMSANLIAALPFLVMGLLQMLSPGYFQPYFSTTIGRVLLILLVGQIYLGWRIVRRMAEIRVR